MKIQKAERAKIKVPIMLMGASGSGKTLSSLLIAKGIVEAMLPKATDEEHWAKIGMVETEHNRSSLYVNTEHDNVTIGNFLQVELKPPFTVQSYVEAFDMLKQAGVEVIIIDSLTSAWSGEGGLIDKVNELGGAFSDWKKVGPDQQQLLRLLSDTDVHVIATSRSKQGIEVTRNDVGKVQVEKVGLKPDLKDGLEYEFTITFQLYQDHSAQAMKDNSSIFTEQRPLNRETGHKIYAWAEEGVDLVAEERERKRKALIAIETLAKDEVAAKSLEMLKKRVGKDNLADWTLEELAKGYKYAEAQAKKEKTKTAEKKAAATKQPTKKESAEK
jgi:hypothetical protein